MVRPPPNEAVVIVGVGHRYPQIKMDRDNFFVLPFLQATYRLPVRTMKCEVITQDVPSQTGFRVDVIGTAKIKTYGKEDRKSFMNAASLFLDCELALIAKTCIRTLEAYQSTMVGGMKRERIEDILSERNAQNQMEFIGDVIMEVTSSELRDMGIQILSYTIDQVTKSPSRGKIQLGLNTEEYSYETDESDILRRRNSAKYWPIKKCGPNEALVITGGLYSRPKFIVGGRVFVLPSVHKVVRLPLYNFMLKITTKGVYSATLGAPVDFIANAVLKIYPREKKCLEAAAEKFANKSLANIKETCTRVMEDSQSEILEAMDLEDVLKDREFFSRQVKDVASMNLLAIGIQLISYTTVGHTGPYMKRL